MGNYTQVADPTADPGFKTLWVEEEPEKNPHRLFAGRAPFVRTGRNVNEPVTSMLEIMPLSTRERLRLRGEGKIIRKIKENAVGTTYHKR